jgi:hypothetical protein
MSRPGRGVGWGRGGPLSLPHAPCAPLPTHPPPHPHPIGLRMSNPTRPPTGAKILALVCMLRLQGFHTDRPHRPHRPDHPPPNWPSTTPGAFPRHQTVPASVSCLPHSPCLHLPWGHPHHYARMHAMHVSGSGSGPGQGPHSPHRLAYSMYYTVLSVHALYRAVQRLGGAMAARLEAIWRAAP